MAHSIIYAEYSCRSVVSISHFSLIGGNFFKSAYTRWEESR